MKYSLISLGKELGRELSTGWKQLGVSCQRNKPAILTGTGIIAQVAALYFAHRAGAKAKEALEEKKKELGRSELTVKEFLQAAGKYYIPMAVLEAASIGCITTGMRIEHGRTVAFATAAGIAEGNYQTLRDKLKEKIGEKKTEEIEKEVDVDRLAELEKKENEILETGHGRSLFVDGKTGIQFRSDKDFLERSAIRFNQRLQRSESLMLNDWFETIDLPPCDLGYELGFNITKDANGKDIPVGDERGLLKLRFASRLMDNGAHYTLVNYDLKPRWDWQSHY